MARSQYVYVVQAKGCITPLAAFTVKHEMETWLSRYNGPADLIYWRVRNADQTVTRLDFDV